MSLRAIAKSLKVNRKTVIRALKFKNRLKPEPGRQK
jgi:DNA-binding transcriptional regulator YhcF (GntR family)